MSQMSANYRTQPCAIAMEGKKCFRSHCGYAHTKEELRVPSCKWSSKCNNFACTFLHPHETREMYVKRTGKRWPADAINFPVVVKKASKQQAHNCLLALQGHLKGLNEVAPIMVADDEDRKMRSLTDSFSDLSVSSNMVTEESENESEDEESEFKVILDGEYSKMEYTNVDVESVDCMSD